MHERSRYRLTDIKQSNDKGALRCSTCRHGITQDPGDQALNRGQSRHPHVQWQKLGVGSSQLPLGRLLDLPKQHLYETLTSHDTRFTHPLTLRRSLLLSLSSTVNISGEGALGSFPCGTARVLVDTIAFSRIEVMARLWPTACHIPASSACAAIDLLSTSALSSPFSHTAHLCTVENQSFSLAASHHDLAQLIVCKRQTPPRHVLGPNHFADGLVRRP